MDALLLLLLDSRAPAGAHHHSGGMEAAVMTGLVTDLAGTEDFCRTRLRTSARVSAAFAAASCRLFLNERDDVPAQLTLLDIECGARIPSEATRRASLTATFSYGLVHRQIFVIDVAGGDFGGGRRPAPERPHGAGQRARGRRGAGGQAARRFVYAGP
jgi:hypothetical protein